MHIDARLSRLTTLSPAALRDEWSAVFGAPAPAAFGPDLLALGIAYRLQQKIGGGLPSKTASELARLAGGIRRGAAVPSLRPGTRLAREWHGRTHHVDVMETGFRYREQDYRSLTAIARKITGAGWSGPRFFGLRGRGIGRGEGK